MNVIELDVPDGTRIDLLLNPAWSEIDADDPNVADHLVFAIADAHARFVAEAGDDFDLESLDSLQQARWELEALANLGELLEESMESAPRQSVRAVAVDVLHPTSRATVLLLSAWLSPNDPNEWRSDHLTATVLDRIAPELAPFLLCEDLVTSDGVVTLLTLRPPVAIEGSIAIAVVRPTDDIALVLELRAMGSQASVAAGLLERIALAAGVSRRRGDPETSSGQEKPRNARFDEGKSGHEL